MLLYVCVAGSYKNRYTVCLNLSDANMHFSGCEMSMSIQGDFALLHSCSFIRTQFPSCCAGD